MGLLSYLFKKIIYFIIFFCILVFIPNFPPKTVFPFSSFDVTPPKELTGPLELNSFLDKAERLFENKIYGPEHLIGKGNDIFTSAGNGEILKINGNHITHVAKIGQPCEYFEMEKCGRPLGMSFDVTGNNLIVSDAFYGIWQINLDNGKKTLLVSNRLKYGTNNSRKNKVFNSVAVHSSGDIYFTDSSSDYTLDNGIKAMFCNPSGRVFHYDRKKNMSNVLIDEIHFANGIVLSPNEDFLVISETGKSRLIKYHLKGDKKGLTEVFIDGLPGSPDNLTPAPNGVWVPLVTPADSEHPSLISSLTQVHLVRLFLVRLFILIEAPFKFIENIYPNVYTKIALHYLGHFELIVSILPKRATVIFVDWNGEIVTSMHGLDGSAGRISHVLEHKDFLYFGSPFNHFLARIKYPNEVKQKINNIKIDTPKVVPKVESKPTPKPTSPPPTTTTTPKSTTTTTTPKPTTATPKKVETPKPTTQPPPKKVETPKPTTQPPPKKVETPKPTEAPKKQETVKPSAQQVPKREVPSKPAPIHENVVDTEKPDHGKMKVIKKGGVHGEL